MRLCLACKGQNRDQARFCGHCGIRLGEVPTTQKEQPGEDRGKGWPWVIGLNMLSLVLTGTMTVLMWRHISPLVAIAFWTTGLGFIVAFLPFWIWLIFVAPVPSFLQGKEQAMLLGYLLGKRRGQAQAGQRI